MVSCVSCAAWYVVGRVSEGLVSCAARCHVYLVLHDIMCVGCKKVSCLLLRGTLHGVMCIF